MMKTAFFCLLTMIFTLGVAYPQTPSAAPVSGVRAELLSQLQAVQDKILSLAEAVPAEKYSWRPAQGVRSISEVYVHIATANFLLTQFVGAHPPAGLSPEMEKTVTEKPKIIELLKQSFEHVRNSIITSYETDLDKPAKFFGKTTTVRDVYLNVLMHLHEHLGQSIAYARTNGIVPPWNAVAETQTKPAY